MSERTYLVNTRFLASDFDLALAYDRYLQRISAARGVMRVEWVSAEPRLSSNELVRSNLMDWNLHERSGATIENSSLYVISAVVSSSDDPFRISDLLMLSDADEAPAPFASNISISAMVRPDLE